MTVMMLATQSRRKGRMRSGRVSAKSPENATVAG
jgi:hypothetical protein